MRKTRMRVGGLCFLTVVLLAAVVGAVDGYSMSGSSSVETPTRTVSYEGQNYTIDSVSRIFAGESVTITTSVPTDAAYNINLRGPDNQLISSERKTGDGTHTLSYFGPNDEAGTYAATIEDGGNTVAVYPIVIAGYDISVASPDDVESGETVTISATVTDRSVEKHSSLDRVEVVVGNDDVEVQQSMRQVDDETYETTISTDELSAETYNVYVVVRGNKTVRDRAEILGVSDTVALTVTDTVTPTATNEDGADDGNAGTGGTGGNTGAETESDTRTPTATPEPTPTTPQPTESTTPTSDPGEGPTPTVTGETDSNGGATNVIEPATSTTASTSSGSGPGFTVGLALLGVLTAIAIGQNRD